MTDKIIIEYLKSGKPKQRSKALGYIYKLHFPEITRYIQKNSGNSTDAEDIFQDGLVAFYEQVVKDEFRQASTLKTYLFSICRFLWMKRLRKSSTKNELYNIEEDFVDDNKLAFESIIEDEESLKLAKIIELGGEDCKRILILYYYERKKMNEIANLMNLSNADVAKNKKNRCIKKIRSVVKSNPDLMLRK